MYNPSHENVADPSKVNWLNVIPAVLGKRILKYGVTNYHSIESCLLAGCRQMVCVGQNDRDYDSAPIRFVDSDKDLPRKAFDVCIIDSKMPGMNGYEVARTIRNQEPPVQNLPLIEFSSPTANGAKESQKAGFDGFLAKPIHRQKLFDRHSLL